MSRSSSSFYGLARVDRLLLHVFPSRASSSWSKTWQRSMVTCVELTSRRGSRTRRRSDGRVDGVAASRRCHRREATSTASRQHAIAAPPPRFKLTFDADHTCGSSATGARGRSGSADLQRGIFVHEDAREVQLTQSLREHGVTSCGGAFTSQWPVAIHDVEISFFSV